MADGDLAAEEAAATGPKGIPGFLGRHPVPILSLLCLLLCLLLYLLHLL